PESTKNTRLVPPPLIVSPDAPEPSMLTLAAIAGNGPLAMLPAMIVEFAGRLNVIDEPGAALAATIASRSDPAPLSPVLVPMNCAACAPDASPAAAKSQTRSRAAAPSRDLRPGNRTTAVPNK